VLADEGKAKAVAFDEIDKAPEEKKRGITIATVWILFCCFFYSVQLICYIFYFMFCDQVLCKSM
jgi:hypothetical protein